MAEELKKAQNELRRRQATISVLEHEQADLVKRLTLSQERILKRDTMIVSDSLVAERTPGCYEHHRSELTVVNRSSVRSSIRLIRRSERSTIFTERGCLCQIQVKRKNETLPSKMKKADSIRGCFTEDASITEMQLRYSHWTTLWNTFMDSNDEYSQLLSPEEQETDKS